MSYPASRSTRTKRLRRGTAASSADQLSGGNRLAGPDASPERASHFSARRRRVHRRGRSGPTLVSEQPGWRRGAASGGGRSHWAIENSLHWPLDLVLRDDESCVRNGRAAGNFGVVRPIALNLLRRETTVKVGVKAKRLMCGWDNAYLLKVLAS